MLICVQEIRGGTPGWRVHLVGSLVEIDTHSVGLSTGKEERR